MDLPCLDGGPESTWIGCTKFYKGCTKFCEGCNMGSKVRLEVGISPQSLPYGLLNEIMDHPCSTGGLESNRTGCTKFCKECTKGSRVRSEVGIDIQPLPYGFQNEIMDHPCSDGGPESTQI